MKTQDPPDRSAPAPQHTDAAAREERRAFDLLGAIAIGTAIAALAVVFASFNHDVVPDEHHVGSAAFLWWRLGFIALAVGLIAFAVAREYQHRRAVRALLVERQRMFDADRVRADVVASVTHELKTPLTSLLGYASILRKRADSIDPEQREEYLGVLESQGHRILHLIEELLQSSRLETALSKMQRAPLDLAALARDVGREMSVARARRIEVEAPQGDLGLFGDRPALEHILTNLLDNALKYSDASTVVHVSVIEQPSEVWLVVRDEGSGIAPEDLPHIFERFRQTARSRGHASVGLGLYIVRNLVEAHGGRVWAESGPGAGTTMTVALPRRAAR